MSQHATRQQVLSSTYSRLLEGLCTEDLCTKGKAKKPDRRSGD